MRLQKDIFCIAAASQLTYPIIQSNSMYDFSRYQDVIGQLPLLKSYSHLCLCFPVHDQSSRDEIVEKLQTAALKLTTAIPLLAGKVINEGSSPSNSGLFKAVPCSLWSPPNTIVRVKDCSNVCPSYNELVDAKGPVSMLDGDVLCPRKAFPASYEETESDPAPVVALQANFIRGGLLLDCAAQHNMIDMSGIEQVLRLLATALRGEGIPLLAIGQGNRDRRNMIRLLSPDEPLGDHGHLRRAQPGEKRNFPLEPDSPYRWCNFRFSPASQARLKTLASNPYSESNSTIPFVSTNDALTAFCWQRIITARQHRRQSPTAISKFCRAVDGRKALGVPKEYMGHMVHIATSWLTFEELETLPLATIACALRKSVNDVNGEYTVRSWTTLISNEPDKSNIVFGGKFNPDTDIGSSSWAHVSLCREEFGVLGKPSLIRRPNFMPLKSDVYFLPRTEEGDIDALVCVNELDFEALKLDEEWNAYAEHIG